MISCSKEKGSRANSNANSNNSFELDPLKQKTLKKGYLLDANVYKTDKNSLFTKRYMYVPKKFSPKNQTL